MSGTALSKRQGVRFDLDEVMNDWLAGKTQELGFSEANLELAVLYPFRFVRKTDRITDAQTE